MKRSSLHHIERELYVFARACELIAIYSSNKYELHRLHMLPGWNGELPMIFELYY